MNIVRAVPTQALALTTIALASKRYWQYPERWIELWQPLLTITPDYIANHEVYASLADESELCGFYALDGEGATLTLEHLWLAPTTIGRGYGRSLMQHAIQRARELGAQLLDVEADPNAQGFYEHLGAQLIGARVTDLEGQPRILPVLRFDLAS